MRRKFHISYILYLISYICYSQPATIQGYAPDYKGKAIAAFTYKDYITNTPSKLDAETINDSGYFSVTLNNLKKCTYIYLSIDNIKGTVYVEPGKLYRVAFPPPDSNHYQNQFIEHVVDLDFIIRDSLDINNLVIDFNDQFNRFWRKNYTYFIKKRAPPYLDTFYIAMQKRYDKISNPYFKGYIRYFVADLGINILEGEKTLGEKYLKDKPVLYDNYQYMLFFNDYFKDYMSQVVYTREGKDINNFIAHPSYADLMAVLKINHLLRNDSLCELVLLKGLYEFYYSGEYDKESIKTLLKTIANTSQISDDKVIANDMLASFTVVTSGQTVPEFALKDAKGDVASVLDYRGKYLYLAFYKSGSSASLSEMEIVPALYKQFGKKINFVFICEDDSYDEFQNFLKVNKPFTWTFLYDEGHRALGLYDVRSLPEYFLIAPNGKFYMSPADGPSHGIQETFEVLTKPKKSK